jgi:hypothetical protein
MPIGVAPESDRRGYSAGEFGPCGLTSATGGTVVVPRPGMGPSAIRAEIMRSGGPLMVAAGAGLAYGFGALAVLVALGAAVAVTRRRTA